MKVLFIAGSDFTIHPNHRAHHFVTFLEEYADCVDTISLKRFYSGPSFAGPWTRFWQGLREGRGNAVEIIESQSGTHIIIQRLPGRLDYIAQDIWACFHLQRLFDQEYDFCVFGNPDNVFIPWFLKKKGVIKTVIYDDWDYYCGFDNSWFVKLLIKIREKMCVSMSDTVVSVGNLLSELRKRQGAKRTCVIPNGVNYKLFAKAQQKKTHPPTLIYIGKLADEYGIDISLKGFSQVLREIPAAKYLIVGYNEGQYSRYLQDLADGLGISNNVTFLGQKRYEELPDILAQADIGVALFKPNDLMKYTFPLKVVEYMAAGLAVVGTKIGETGILIAEAKSGDALDCSPDRFAHVVIDMFSDEARLLQCCENAREYAKRYDWSVLFSAFFEYIGFQVAPEDVGERSAAV